MKKEGGKGWKVGLRVEDEPAWLTPRDAAVYLHVGVDIIYDACATGGLKHSKLGHRTIRIRPEWIDLWADEHATEHR